MTLIKCYWMLQNARIAAFTVAELLRENQQWGKKLGIMLPSKWENLSGSTKLMHFCKKLPLGWDCRQSKYSLYIYNIRFLNFGRGFCTPFSMLFRKAPASSGKKFWNNFCCIVLLFVWSQKVCLRFLKSYFKLEILIFLPFVVSFLADMFN